MIERITASLARLFEEHRIVFWTDPEGEMRETFDAVELDGVEKVAIANNEFGLKYRMLRQEPETRFLVFRDGPDPAFKKNWLLDIELAAGRFRADQAAIWRTELKLPQHFDTLIGEHGEFFKASKRLNALKKVAEATDSPGELRLRMLAICTGAEGGLDTVIETLLGNLAKGRNDGLRVIERAALTGFLWEQIGKAYDYKVDEPDFEDFAMSLFENAWRRALDEEGPLNEEALLVFRRWKNDRRGMEAFETLSEEYAGPLDIEGDIAKRELRDFVTTDHFELVEREIIRRIVSGLAEETLGAADVLSWVRGRRQSHWYKSYEHVYQAIRYSTEFRQSLAQARLKMTDPADGFRQYAASWFRLDQCYRRFIHHMRSSGQVSLLDALATSVENLYATRFVQAVNDAWQDQINTLENWSIPGVPSQVDFYNDVAAEYRRKDQKVAVIVSDALRFEVADELAHAIREQSRFDADLSAMLGVLPSYTQLGMASLLPHGSLSFDGKAGDAVLVNGESSIGRAAREKLLAKGRDGDRVRAIGADDLLKLKSDERKALFREHDIVYVYHNRIDRTGDNLASEEQLTEAVDATVVEIVKLVRTLTSANFSNVLITTDHGFLFQYRPLDEADFSIADPKADEITARSRRFVIGRGLAETPGMMRFAAEQIGMVGDAEILIPNSINRMRVKGAGSRYVHGGASLQEVVLPVLRVGKQRAADISTVDVQIVVPGRNLITSGQIAVTFFQKDPVTEKRQPATLRAGIYAEDGTVISDEHDLVFDLVAENPRERETPTKFLLSRAADQYNNKTVFLKLKQQIGKTTRYEDYASQPLQLRRGIETDFDF